ncbi:MAG: adenylosuccinate synthase [Dehalococcoidia bacterium]|nr:adenylosuccinate synthase [Dehalococcoidia bacterium]
MPAYAIIGGQWGDEGKGKVVDLLSEKADIVARFNGGNNAGHTVINSMGNFKFHLIPVGILRTNCIPLIGNGVVVNPDAFAAELATLHESDVDTSNLIISEKAHLIMPYHIKLDELEERRRSEVGEAIGTTGMGIGPVYMDKTSRIGLRMIDLLDKDTLFHKLKVVLRQKNDVISKLYGGDPIDLDYSYERCLVWAEELASYIKPIEPVLHDALSSGKKIMLEGAQGAMLDLDHGTYPYVTSSSPSVGGACTGLGISPRDIAGVAGVFKAYTTRVGSGALPTELHDEVGEFIRETAGEYGTTTGRPRRCGWFDGVAARYSSRINGFTSAILTRLDVLDGISPIRICTSYKYNGKQLTEFPADAFILENCEPVYEDMPGWNKPTASVTNLGDLPQEALNYIERLSEIIGCPIDMISTGPGREEAIIVKPIF